MEQLEMVNRKLNETTTASQVKEMELHMDEALQR
jgi:hypothetical protein